MSSLSASAENLTGDSQSNDGSSMCLELALEGERLCKAGDCRAGVAFFQAAIQAGTDDLRTLSAIYSQLGNAYFYLGDYSKAMQYHKLDLTLARSMNDKLGEAKSSGNLGNTFKVMGRFDEAAMCCDRHLTLARQLGDRLSEGRALYNLGNVYHAKGKHMGQKDPGDFSDEVKEALTKAVEFYQQNLKLMRELGDRGAQGRACGNLGNTYYLLGDFEAAIEHHQERLRIAKEFGDKAAERRANSNLGNSHIFLGQFEDAADHYKRTLSLAIELGEQAVEAQACYSLGNTYTLLRDFPTAIDYHYRHLAIAQELGDRVGEARACWSLGNAHSAIDDHEKALHFAEMHYSLAKELNDTVGISTAKVNIIDLRKHLGLPDFVDDADTSSSEAPSTTGSENTQITPDGKRQNAVQQEEVKPKPPKMNEDDFFEMLSRSQSKRMDDQRCSIKMIGKDSQRKPLTQQNVNANVPKDNGNYLFEMIADVQSKRMDEQRAILPGLKNRSGVNNVINTQPRNNGAPDDAFLDMLMRCQGSRIEEQRSELPRPNVTMDAENSEPTRTRGTSNIGATVPDEDFFSLIMRVQSGRMEDQRATIPLANRIQTTSSTTTTQHSTKNSSDTTSKNKNNSK